MRITEMISCLECNSMVAAVSDDKWETAIGCPSQVIFYQSADLLTVADEVQQAHAAGKYIMVYIHLAKMQTSPCVPARESKCFLVKSALFGADFFITKAKCNEKNSLCNA